jgi:hypothetical protein
MLLPIGAHHRGLQMRGHAIFPAIQPKPATINLAAEETSLLGNWQIRYGLQIYNQFQSRGE